MTYSSDSITDRLGAVRAAIDRCLTSQEYGLEDRKQRSAELKHLMELEASLMQQANEASNNGNMCSLGRIQDVT